MDRRMRRSNLIDKAMLQFTICVTILMLLATPLFYWLTKHYYAEDLILEKTFPHSMLNETSCMES